MMDPVHIRVQLDDQYNAGWMANILALPCFFELPSNYTLF